MELCPSLHLGFVAIKKGDFGLASTAVANLLLCSISYSAKMGILASIIIGTFQYKKKMAVEDMPTSSAGLGIWQGYSLVCLPTCHFALFSSSSFLFRHHTESDSKDGSSQHTDKEIPNKK